MIFGLSYSMEILFWRKIVGMMDQKGRNRFGCIQQLVPGTVVTFDNHSRHAVLPWKCLRIVIVGYTP